jgi:hypothetical protein
MTHGEADMSVRQSMGRFVFGKVVSVSGYD